MALQFCYECGKQMSSTAPSCPHCGAPGKGRGAIQGAAKSPKNRTTAIVLALFLGIVGAHWFYLEQPGRGVRYALFCWTFIPAIFGLIATLQFLTMKDKDFHQRYG